jgi:ribonuclease E
VLEGSTTQCPHCQGTGIIRSVESVALAVLRALEDQLLRDGRSSVNAVTTADVALYILNNKRAFVTDMERRYGIVITVQASERMQGANFAIEKSAAQPAPLKVQERTVVNMEWGFEGQEGQDRQEAPEVEPEEESEEATGSAADREGGRRSRRRRRRGRRDDERPPHGAGERAEFARNGEAEDIAPESAGNGEHGEPRDDSTEPLDGPAGTGEQPVVGRGGEGSDDQRDRPRRRRGRRGGRRGGRDRGETPRELDGDAGNGAGAAGVEAEPSLVHERGAEAGDETHAADLPHEEPAHRHEPETREAPEPRHAPAHADVAPEPAWHAPAERSGNGGAREQRAEPPSAVEETPRREPSPAHVEPVPEEPARPARRGWWQRRLSGE